MIPERNVIGKYAKSVFFEDVNDIDIYIEDTEFGYEKLYSVLFSRLLIDQYRVEKVFPLGGRKAVIERFNFQISTTTDRPFLFIIDSDLFLLSGDNEKSKRGLYKVPFYCVENILIDWDAIHNILDEEEQVKSKDSLINEFDCTGWLEQNETKLFDLFVEYAISFKINPEEKTVKHKVKYLVSNNNGCIDEAKFNERIKNIRQITVEKVGIEQYKKARELVLANFEMSSVNKLDVVSGKDYLMPLIMTRFKSIVNTKIPNINFKLRLAKICDIEKIRDCFSYVAR